MPIPCVSFPYLIITLQADLKFGVEQGVDMVFASFIRKAQDVAACREELGEKGKHILIISKVTTPQKLELPCGTLPHPLHLYRSGMGHDQYYLNSCTESEVLQ